MCNDVNCPCDLRMQCQGYASKTLADASECAVSGCPTSHQAWLYQWGRRGLRFHPSGTDFNIKWSPTQDSGQIFLLTCILRDPLPPCISLSVSRLLRFILIPPHPPAQSILTDPQATEHTFFCPPNGLKAQSDHRHGSGPQGW